MSSSQCVRVAGGILFVLGLVGLFDIVTWLPWQLSWYSLIGVPGIIIGTLWLVNPPPFRAQAAAATPLVWVGCALAAIGTVPMLRPPVFVSPPGEVFGYTDIIKVSFVFVGFCGLSIALGGIFWSWLSRPKG